MSAFRASRFADLSFLHWLSCCALIRLASASSNDPRASSNSGSMVACRALRLARLSALSLSYFCRSMNARCVSLIFFGMSERCLLSLYIGLSILYVFPFYLIDSCDTSKFISTYDGIFLHEEFPFLQLHGRTFALKMQNVSTCTIEVEHRCPFRAKVSRSKLFMKASPDMRSSFLLSPPSAVLKNGFLNMTYRFF